MVGRSGRWIDQWRAPPQWWRCCFDHLCWKSWAERQSCWFTGLFMYHEVWIMIKSGLDPELAEGVIYPLWSGDQLGTPSRPPLQALQDGWSVQRPGFYVTYWSPGAQPQSVVWKLPDRVCPVQHPISSSVSWSWLNLLVFSKRTVICWQAPCPNNRFSLQTGSPSFHPTDPTSLSLSAAFCSRREQPSESVDGSEKLRGC